MQRDLWGAIVPHRNHARACTNGRVADHITVLPWTGPNMTWKDRRQSNRNAPGKADLPAMGVPAEEQAKVSIGSLLIDLRCVRQQDRKIPEGDSGRSLLNVIDAIKMRIIDPGWVNALIVPLIGL